MSPYVNILLGFSVIDLLFTFHCRFGTFVSFKADLPVQEVLEEHLQEESTKGRIRSGRVQGCEQFRSSNFSWPAHLQTVAIVGNGPLKEESRTQISVRSRLYKKALLKPESAEECIKITSRLHI